MPEVQKMILDTTSSWRNWIATVKEMALYGDTDVWSFIDPDLASQPPQPSKPTRPIVDFEEISNPEGREVFRYEIQFYQEDLREYERRIRVLGNIRTWIREHISITNYVFIREEITVWKSIRNLKDHLAPTDQARKFEMIKEYAKLKKYSKSQKVEAYIQDWETTVAECLLLRLPDVAEERPQEDFTAAIAGIDSQFASNMQFKYSELRSESQPILEFTKLTQMFRDHYRRTEALKPYSSPGSSSAFTASTEGESYKGTKRGEEKEKRECLCGVKHAWKQCPYLVPEKAVGVQLDQEIVTKINEKLESLPWLAKLVFNATKYSIRATTSPETPTAAGKAVASTRRIRLPPMPLEDFEQTSKATFSARIQRSTPQPINIEKHSFNTSKNHNLQKSMKTQSHQYKGDLTFYNAWILDGGSESNICNDAGRSDFTTTHKAAPDDVILSGKSRYKIESYGTTKIWIDAPEGRRFFTLTDVALVPGYMTNIVMEEAVIKARVYRYTKNPETLIDNDGQVFCTLKPLGKLFAFELDVPIEKRRRALTTTKASGHSQEPQKPVEIDRVLQCQPEHTKEEPFWIDQDVIISPEKSTENEPTLQETLDLQPMTLEPSPEPSTESNSQASEILGGQNQNRLESPLSAPPTSKTTENLLQEGGNQIMKPPTTKIHHRDTLPVQLINWKERLKHLLKHSWLYSNGLEWDTLLYLIWFYT
ncbi:hypothetical protein HYALB_00007744 [Hymenoscyphus albidus]|uniref:Retrovirus-related Pol polyprotein from transposon TNT 1-94-like beta-barrel domain-containing protein n=1 Tax=Hymenoscyphus albidus TaxID=595503 RepID=A0A9N9LI79_9HELO|nr:hypothetical protein HYALB_00007744 [Hymenoscyphus albidus]